MATGVDSPLVGRERELAQLDRALDGVDGGSGRTVVVTGEPGIGKTRLLSELVQRADARGWMVLEGRGAEFERELPFGIVVDACDEYLGSLDGRSAERLAGEGLAELATIFPTLVSLAPTDARPLLVDERYRAHRAVSELLSNLAVGRPLALVLDDVHWADEASAELLGHLVRRPPAHAICVVLAYRTGQAPARLAEGLTAARHDNHLEAIELAPLSAAASATLVEGLDAPASEALYRESGGNPFYLEQLARAGEPAEGWEDGGTPATAQDVPAAVAAAIGRELDELSASARRTLEAAALAGDPFEPDLAAAIGDEPEEEALAALDELAACGLVRSTRVPRRFAFRHPIVRRVVYAGTSPGWRLAAHGRAAEALAARGAPPLERAHHVEQAARPGDEEAAAILAEAGKRLVTRAPASAARWLAASLRLMPERDGWREQRLDLLELLAGTRAASGRYAESRAALLELLERLPAGADALRVGTTARCASVEHVLGRHNDAHERLRAALEELSDQDSPEAVALMIELSVDAFYSVDHEAMRDRGVAALDAATRLGRRPLIAVAAAIASFGGVIAGDPTAAERYRREAVVLVEELSDAALAERIDALNYLGWAERYMGRFADALLHFERGIAISQASGRGDALSPLRTGQEVVLAHLGRLEEAIAVSRASVESARLSRSPQALCWALNNSCLWATWAGDLETARRAAEEAREVAGPVDQSTMVLIGAFDQATYLVETGDHARGAELGIEAAGGLELALDSPAWVASHCEVLTEAMLGLDRQADAARLAERAREAADDLGWALVHGQAERARARTLLAAGDPVGAAEAALGSMASFAATGAVLDASRSRLLAGRALAGAGERERAKGELRRAEAELRDCGADRWRSEAIRELRKLGVRVEPARRGGATGDAGLPSLSVREREIARLVWDRKTNAEIAAELFVSKKTVETHLRNIFRKLDASSRVDVARIVEESGDAR